MSVSIYYLTVLTAHKSPRKLFKGRFWLPVNRRELCRCFWCTLLLVWWAIPFQTGKICHGVWTASIRAVLNKSAAKSKTACGKRDQQLQHIEPKKSRNVTLTPWMSPFMRNVCWGNVWCNTCRINTDKAEWNHLTRNCVLHYKKRKQQWSPTVCHKLHVLFQTPVKVKCVFRTRFWPRLFLHFSGGTEISICILWTCWGHTRVKPSDGFNSNNWASIVWFGAVISKIWLPEMSKD